MHPLQFTWEDDVRPMQSHPAVRRLVAGALFGVASLASFGPVRAANPPSDAQNRVPRLVRGLRGQTLDSVRQGLDKWYAANPGRLQRPVLETIWFEIALPGLK